MKKSLYDKCAIMIQDKEQCTSYTYYDIIHHIALIGYKIGATEGMGLLLTKEQEKFIKDANLYEHRENDND